MKLSEAGNVCWPWGLSSSQHRLPQLCFSLTPFSLGPQSQSVPSLPVTSDLGSSPPPSQHAPRDRTGVSVGSVASLQPWP